VSARVRTVEMYHEQKMQGRIKGRMLHHFVAHKIPFLAFFSFFGGRGGGGGGAAKVLKKNYPPCAILTEFDPPWFQHMFLIDPVWSVESVYVGKGWRFCYCTAVKPAT
jgi:hypothetical protein